MYARSALASLTLVSLVVLAGCGGDGPMDEGDGHVPDGGAADGDAPDGDAPDGDAPDGDAPDGDAPDDCGAPGVRCGRFVFAVTGLHYATPTLEGETDGDGTFRYRAGESVTFSVGGVELGDAPGAATISPFDLAGAPLPATEAAIRAELHEPREVSPFDEAANIAHFLIALDADFALANGVEVSAWHTILAAETLSFAVPLYEFRDAELMRLARRYGVSRNVPIDLPLAHLYDALDVVVPAHVATSDFEERTFGGQFMPSYEVRSAYDADGRTTSLLYYEDQGSGELWDGERTAYDALGRRTSFELLLPDGGVTVAWRVSTWTYDARGNVATTEVRVDADHDGTFDPPTTTTFAYDARDNVVLETTVVPDGRSISIVRFLDVDGNETTTVIDDDVTGSVSMLARTFDAEGRVLTEQHDVNTGGARTQMVTTSTYDASGGLLTRQHTVDIGADGSVDRTDARTHTRHPNGRPATTVDRFQIGHSNEWRRTETHDTRGRTTHQLEQRVRVGDIFLHEVTFERRYASNGDLERAAREQIANGTRLWSEVTRTYGYSTAGFLEQRVSVTDGDDSVDRHTRRNTFSYEARASGVRALVLAYVPPPAS